MAGTSEKSLALASLMILCCLSVSAQTAQVLPEVDTYFKLSSDLRVSLQAKQTRQASDPVQAEIGPSFDFYLKPLLHLKDIAAFDLDDSKARPLVFSIGYRYLPQANGAPATNRMEPVVTFRFPMTRFLLTDRNRADLDWKSRSTIRTEPRSSLAPSTIFGPLSRRSAGIAGRSEERRVGKECRSRWSPDP